MRKRYFIFLNVSGITALLICLVIATAIVLASYSAARIAMATQGRHIAQATPSVLTTPTTLPTSPASTPTTPAIAVATASPSITPYQLAESEMAILRSREGPDGWTWQTNLPEHRLVVFYGNPLSSVMGPLGQFSDNDLITKLQQQAQVYASLDPAHPVVPAFDYVTPIVQPVPMDDGSWVYRMPADSIEHYINLANANHMLFFFDMQLGHSTIQKEVNLVWPYLERPGVDLTLDPEFDMPPGAIPDQVFGHMSAAEINWAIHQLSTLVQSEHLPPKILIIHQFREDMLPDWQNIKLEPGVQVITCVDGFGTPSEKIDDYQIFDKEQLLQYPGMKLFYKLDIPLMSPTDVLALNPPPMMVMYQ
jgi:hypothetical protein